MICLSQYKLAQYTQQNFVFAVLNKLQKNSQKNFCDFKKNDNHSTKDEVELPEEPQNCCMSGCANCVWVAYAEKLAELLKDEGETARQKIIENVKDPNLRTFILLELDHLLKKKKN